MYMQCVCVCVACAYGCCYQHNGVHAFQKNASSFLEEYIHISAYTYRNIYMYINSRNTCTYMYEHIYTYIHTYMLGICIYICVYTYIHTFIHAWNM